MSISAATHAEHPGGRPRTGLGTDPQEATTLRLYLPYVFDDDIQRQATARKQVLDLLQKPGGIADQVYQQEVDFLTKYVNSSVKSYADFQDLMYSKIHPQYIQMMERTIFRPEIISRIVNPESGQRSDKQMRSTESMAHRKIADVLRSLLRSLAGQERQLLGLTDSAGHYSIPSAKNNWRHNEEVSLDAPASQGEGAQDLINAIPGPASEQPEHNMKALVSEVAAEAPAEIREHVESIVSTMAERLEEDMNPTELAEDTRAIVEWYAAERLHVIEQLPEGDAPDKIFWQDPAVLQKLSDKITATILAYENAEG
jgi:predicted Zn-dependent protease with MMP-like domain